MSGRLATGFESPDESPGLLLWQVSNRWQRRQRAALEPLGLTHVQFVLLASITWFSGEGVALTQVELAGHAGTDVMMTSQVVRTLESRGWIRRDRDLRDPRARRLIVTPEGAALANRAVGIVEATDAAFFAALGERGTEFTRALRMLATGGERGSDQA